MVAAIAALELPRKEWHEVIGVLVQNAQGTDTTFKLAALETLGYICEELDKGVLNEAEVDSILSAIVNSMTGENEVKDVAMNALQLVIPFCEKNLKHETERALLLSKIAENCKAEKEEIKSKAMKCLLELVRCFYDHIGSDGLDLAGHVTIAEIKKKDNEDIGVLAVELWCTICDEEINRLKRPSPTTPCRNYIQTASTILLPLLLDALKNTSSDDDETWDMALASACCISLMAEILKDNIVLVVIDHVSKCFASAEWKDKKAGIMAFVSILKGPNKDKMNQYIIQILGNFLALLQDKQPQLRETVALAFSKLTESNCDILINPQIFTHVINAFTVSLKDTPRISNHICFAINNIASELRPSETQTTSLMSPIFKQLLQSLWENSFRGDAFGDSVNLAYSSFVAFSNIILNSPPDCLASLDVVFKMLVEMFNSTINGTFSIPAHLTDFQGYICTALHPVFMKLGAKMDSKILESVVNLLVDSFRLRNAVYDEGLQAFDGLILGVGKGFQPFTEKLGPYLVHSLKKIDDTILCRVAIGCAGDLARALEEGIIVYLKDLVPLLLEILRNPEGEYGLKPITISALGDLAFFSGKHFEPHLNDVLEILKSASSLSLEPPQDVSDFINYRMTLNFLSTFANSKKPLLRHIQA